ncbi:MAG: hypothetical protein WCP11_03330 [Candidatus Saccharibacteria bacterium]
MINRDLDFIKKSVTFVVSKNDKKVGYTFIAEQHISAELAQAANNLAMYPEDTIVFAGADTCSENDAKQIGSTLGFKITYCDEKMKIAMISGDNHSHYADIIEDNLDTGRTVIYVVDEKTVSKCIEYILKNVFKIKTPFISLEQLSRGCVIQIAYHDIHGKCKKGQVFIVD